MEELPKKYVRIYRFEPETGIHCDTAIAEYTSETPNLDPNWTTIAPTTPPKEYVCVFKNGQWTHEKKDGSSCIVVGEEPFLQIKSLIEIGPGRFGKGISIAEQNSNT